ncbi:sensor histidine kinase [Bifidobacterium thermophilum]|uniref:sensor histidine kinase n=1 Tax=Bifidobacterium thermophilum TaxID=33905 RepID=UPI0011819BF5|nr:ATP-binding protein [Bifidobacterium thermophilum]MDW8485464.1 ATP-binding protein [Bifidobacterium thermophilum]
MGSCWTVWYCVVVVTIAACVAAVIAVTLNDIHHGVNPLRRLISHPQGGFLGLGHRTDQRQGQQNVEDLEDSTQALLAMIPVASAVVDDHDDVIRASSAAYTLGVVRDESLCNEDILAAVHEVRSTGGRKQLDITTQTVPQRIVGPKGESVQDAGLQQVRVINGVSRPNWLKVTVGRINSRFVVVLLDDVSESIRFSQVRESFIQNVSEQLIEPSQALERLADSLEHDDLDRESVKRQAVEVRRACKHMEHMVSDLLLLIRSQEPVTPSSHNRINVMDQLRDVVQSHLGRAQQAGVQLELSGDDSLDINGESDQIKAAVGKLIENAIGYSPQGSTVAVSVKRSQEGGHASVSVIDRGCGIPKAEQERVFERFYRGSEQNERTEHGIGLGLAIVKHVALTHHGNVTVWSVPGQGSTFTMSLPLAQDIVTA